MEHELKFQIYKFQIMKSDQYNSKALSQGEECRPKSFRRCNFRMIQMRFIRSKTRVGLGPPTYSTRLGTSLITIQRVDQCTYYVDRVMLSSIQRETAFRLRSQNCTDTVYMVSQI